MLKFSNLIFAIENSIATITINREDKLNALNTATIEELRLAVRVIYDDTEIRAGIITGIGGKSFVAGADISEVAQLNELNGRKYAEIGQEVFRMIENAPKPIIAAINGYALGGGCELAMSCHLRIAVQTAKFGQPEVNLGVIPGYGGTQRLSQLIGKSKALELLLTGDIIDAEQAADLGLINHVTATQEQLWEKTHELLNKILSKAPRALEMVIQSVNAAYEPGQNGYQTEANGFANCCATQDFKEGTSAFLEKRPPKFTGN